MNTYRLAFRWTNSYGRSRDAVVWAKAGSEATAVRAGRVELRELYGIERARFVSASVDD